MIVVGLSGFAQSGKDEAAFALTRQLGFVRRAYADALRAGVEGMNPIVGFNSGQAVHYSDAIRVHGYEGAKANFPEVRRFLQVYGTEGGRNIFGPDIWVDTLFDWAEAQGVKRLVIPDVRFENEIDAIEDRQGLVYRISRPGVGAINTHVSEALSDEDFDRSMIVVNNDDVTTLHKKIVRRVSEAFGL